MWEQGQGTEEEFGGTLSAGRKQDRDNFRNRNNLSVQPSGCMAIRYLGGRVIAGRGRLGVKTVAVRTLTRQYPAA